MRISDTKCTCVGHDLIMSYIPDVVLDYRLMVRVDVWCRPTARLMPVAVKPRPAAGSASGAMPRPSSASPAPLGTSRPPSGKRPPSASPSQPAAASVAAMSAAAESGTPAWNVGAKRARLDDDQHSAAAAGQSTSSAQKAAEGLASHGADDQEAAAGGLSSLLGEICCSCRSIAAWLSHLS